MPDQNFLMTSLFVLAIDSYMKDSNALHYCEDIEKEEKLRRKNIIFIWCSGELSAFPCFKRKNHPCVVNNTKKRTDLVGASNMYRKKWIFFLLK